MCVQSNVQYKHHICIYPKNLSKFSPLKLMNWQTLRKTSSEVGIWIYFMAVKERITNSSGFTCCCSAKMCLVEEIWVLERVLWPSSLRGRYGVFVQWMCVCSSPSFWTQAGECLEGGEGFASWLFSLCLYTAIILVCVPSDAFPHCSVTVVDTCQLLFLLPVSCSWSRMGSYGW